MTLLEKLIAIRVIIKYSAFYKTQTFISVFIRSRHWSLISSIRIQPTTSHLISPISILILSYLLLLGRPGGVFPLGVLIKISYAFFTYSIRATGWTIEVLGFDYRRGLGIFLFTTASGAALGPARPPVRWVPGTLSLGVKRPGREADHSPQSSDEIKGWVELYLHSPIRLHGVVLSLKKHRDNFTFSFTFHTGYIPRAISHNPWSDHPSNSTKRYEEIDS
jgi:hypothetical protein